ncbi:hypothetical protein Aam_254_001 [Acidocella aminolytica 101 = DSM 11237]|uniref:Uncharacterized protein n=1 Tax=Acidocella aminolytica 101 = DSM 11237 TaxID=1120923 RepID=A0A0D6PM26_9PROT|nr:hypothetical protein Aam_254_001 [Acidocella aminolytica 101 = DSM 11237]
MAAGPKKCDPGEQAAEIIACGGEDGVHGIAGAPFEVVAVHSVVGFEMSDNGLDGGAAAQLTFDLRGDTALLISTEK